MVVDVAVVERHVLLLQVNAVRDQPLEKIALGAEEAPQLGHRVLQVVDAVERVAARLLGDVVLQPVDDVVELFEHRERGVDQDVDDHVGQEGGLRLGELGILVYALLQLEQDRCRVQVDGDQVVGAYEEVMLPEQHLVVAPLGHEDDREVVLRIVVDLGPLVLVLDVLDGQGMELEDLFKEAIVVLVGGLDIQPEAVGVPGGEAPVDVLDRGIFLPVDREQRSHRLAC